MNVTNALKILAMSAVVALAGCSTGTGIRTTASSGSSATEVAAQDRQISSQQQETDQLQRELRTSKSSAPAAPAIPTGMSSDLFPPNPKTGECYARALIPATYSSATERVLIKEAAERIEIIPARYGNGEERILVKEASSRLEVVPATYKTIEERVLVQPETTRIEQVPATYKKVSERVLVSPARTEWKRGAASGFSNVVDTRSDDTGEIMCLVEVPAVYRDVSRTVTDRAAATRETVIPAVYKTVKKQVIDRPPATREITIPAVYDVVKTTQLVSPAQEKRIAIPAVYDTVTKRTKTSEEDLEWRRVVCDVNLTQGNVTALQRALKSNNRYSGPIDGLLGPMTLSAANSYAKENGLPTGKNYIAWQVVDKLKLKF